MVRVVALSWVLLLLWRHVSPLRARVWPAGPWYCLEPWLVSESIGLLEQRYWPRNFPERVGLPTAKVVLHLCRRSRCSPHLTSCAPSARSSSSARYCTLSRSFAPSTLAHCRACLSVRCTTSSRYLVGKRSSRLARQDTVPSAATSSPSLDAPASLADTLSLSSVRALMSYLSMTPWPRLTPM